MKSFFVILIGGGLALSAAAAAAVQPASALASLTRVPEAAAGRLALIDGHDGAPLPSRWHFLVNDPAAENGLREFVVEDRKVVADRGLSQFASELTPADIVGENQLRVDSNRVAQTALLYAAANQINVVSMNFQMRKSSPEAAPVWTVHCLDENGLQVAAISMRADDGRMIDHPGFALDPEPGWATPGAAPLADTGSVAKPAKAAAPGTPKAAPRAALVAAPLGDPRKSSVRSNAIRERGHSRVTFARNAEEVAPVLEGPPDERDYSPAPPEERTRRLHLPLPDPGRDLRTVGNFLHNLFRPRD